MKEQTEQAAKEYATNPFSKIMRQPIIDKQLYAAFLAGAAHAQGRWSDLDMKDFALKVSLEYRWKGSGFISFIDPNAKMKSITTILEEYTPIQQIPEKS